MKGTILVLLCVALWALIPVVAKLGQNNLDSHQFLFWSSLVSFVALFSTAVIKKKAAFRNYSRSDWFSLSFLGLLGTYIYYLFLYFGYSNAVGLEILAIQYCWPIFIILLAVLILKEKLTLRKSLAAGLGFFGVVTVLTKGSFWTIKLDNYWVIVLVAIGALCFALFSVFSKKVRHEALGVTSVYFLTAAVASFLSMCLFSDFVVPSSQALLPILLNGLFVNGYSYVLWVIALKNADASYLAPFVFLTPILSAVYLIVFFNEPFLAAYAIGLLCVVLGGFINSFRHRAPPGATHLVV